MEATKQNNAKHTDKDWRVSAHETGNYPHRHPQIMFTAHGADYVLADVTYPPSQEGTVGKEEQRANAHLMAASLRLYKGCNALLGLLQMLSSRPDAPAWLREAMDSHRVEEARAAIAKAEGR